MTKALILLLLAVGLIVSGCGSALGAQADLVAIGGITVAASDTVIIGARTRDIEAVKESARVECGATGCAEDRAAFHREALGATVAKWAPALACRPAVVEALRAWADGIGTARAADTESVGLQLVLILARRFLSAYSALGQCVEGVDPGLSLPALPSVLGGLS